MNNIKKCDVLGKIYIFLKTSYEKISFINLFACKSVFWEKGHVILFQSNPFHL